MFGSRWACFVALFAMSSGAVGTEAAQHRQGACFQEVFEGEVRAGQGFERPIGNGLKVVFAPVASGWGVRVLPLSDAGSVLDYAELATPPYRSVSPLLLSTDFSFRSQDAVGWNPRRFHFAPDADGYGRLLKAYQAYEATHPATQAAQEELVTAVGSTPEGTLEILDARLVPGTADQTGAAGAVATHFFNTAHTIDQPEGGRATPLGKIEWVRFRMRLDLPPGFRVERGVRLEGRSCG